MNEYILYTYLIVLLIWLVGASWEYSKPNEDKALSVLMFSVSPFWPAAIVVIVATYPFFLLTRWFERFHEKDDS